MLRPNCGFNLIAMEHAMIPRGHARWDGKPRRCPKKGEYFISGAVPAAYLARQDMTVEYFIAVLVQE